MMYHLFHNSIWKVVRIAKTSDCKISWRVFFARDCNYCIVTFGLASKRNSETNDTSLESPDIELLESEIKLGVAAF